MADHSEKIDLAAAAIAEADAILVGAGAGMGVDSGLPDFRGNEGFWRAYPPFKKRGLSFVDMANPRWFHTDPELAWGFYGHRLHLYRDTKPHAGFGILRRWGADKKHGVFAFTSNVDGHFQRAGFPPNRVVEIHGSIHHFQCSGPCGGEIWSGKSEQVDVDDDFHANQPLPACPRCGVVARPNILMFGDWGWLNERSGDQESRFQAWIDEARDDKIAIVECGAGTHVPSVRMACERLSSRGNATLIRINPRESFGPYRTIEIPTGALEALAAIDQRLES